LKSLNSIFGAVADAYVQAYMADESAALKTRLQNALLHDENQHVFYPPLLMQQLLISGEDHRFFTHVGVDLIAIARAVWRGTVLGRVEGASTIEMQLVRVMSGRYERTVARKFVEMMLACNVSSAVPLTHLPAMYLNRGYYGWRMNGFRQACDRLDMTPRSMTTQQCAELVARLKYPEPQFPSEKRLSQIKRRSAYLLSLWERHKNDGTYGPLSSEQSA
jgi:penicillin-binding protein 1A